MSEPSRAQLIRKSLLWARLYGLVTRRVIRERISARNDRLASRILRTLVRQARLHRHEYTDGVRRLVYYSPERNPYDRGRLQREFSVLWHSTMTEPFQPLLDAQQQRRLLGNLATACGLSLPGRARLALDHSMNETVPRLALILAYADPDAVDLNQMVGFLDRLVSGGKFRLWWHLANRNRFIIQYLVPGPESAFELQRWIARRPPISRSGPTPVPVSVKVYPAECLPVVRST